MMSLICSQNHPPESSGNNQTTLENSVENLPDVTLDHVVKDLLLFFNGFESLHEAKYEIEEKCEIKKEHGHYYWPAKYIKQAWRETQRIDIKSSKRRHWSRVIMVQVLKTSLHYDGFNRVEVKSDLKEDEISPVLNTLSVPDTMSDVAEEITPEQVPSEIPSTSKMRDKMVTTAKRNHDINNKTTIKKEEHLELIDQNFEEMYVSNKENIKGKVKNGLQSTFINQDCGKEQKVRENPEGGSSQSDFELQKVEELKMNMIAQQHSGEDSSGNQRKSTKRSADSLPLSSSERENIKGPSKRLLSRENESGEKDWTREGSKKSNSQTVYIRIPLSVMSGEESASESETVQNVSPTYKLIDGVPNLTELRKKTSYAMLYDNRTRNAAWVYEILNRSTLENRYERRPNFKVDESIHPFFQASESDTKYDDKTYERGHLAAAANHRWCQEANKDTFLLSNMSPQVKDLNRGPWKSLENRYRDKVKNQNEIRNIHVYSGPLYLPINDNSKTVTFSEMVGDKAVPTHFFKVAIEEKHDDTVELECHVCPNGTLEDKDYSESIEYIESVSGLIFTESRSNQDETDIMKKVIWTVKDEDYSAESNVRILCKTLKHRSVFG